MEILKLSEKILSQVAIPTCTPLSHAELINKILGVIYGNALGDALGVRTEFKSSSESKLIWNNSEYTLLNWPIKTKFPEGDWTDDTDQMILILESFLENASILPLDFAARLCRWRDHGFAELGDTIGLGMGKTVRLATTNKNYLKDPIYAATSAWIKNKCDLAANGALMRTSVLGIINYNNLTQVINQTLEIALTTHIDPRSVVACVAQTSAIALFLQGHDFNEVFRISKQISRVALKDYTEVLDDYIGGNHGKENYLKFRRNIDAFRVELLNKYLDNDFEGILPIDGKDMGYSYICMGCAFWAVTQDNWMNAIERIVLEGGDADTNAAVAGALLGAKIGYNGLPQRLVQELRFKDWLHEKILRLFNVLGINQ